MADAGAPQGIDGKRIIGISLLGVAFIVFLIMGLEIGVSTEEDLSSGPVWWEVGPHAVGTLDKLTATEADVKTDTGEQTFMVTNHTMMITFGGQVAVGQKVLVKYLSGQKDKEARVIRTLTAKEAGGGATSAEGSGSPAASAEGSGSPAASAEGSGNPAASPSAAPSGASPDAASPSASGT